MDNDSVITNISKLGSMSTAVGCEAMRQLETESSRGKDVYAHLDKLFKLLVLGLLVRELAVELSNVLLLRFNVGLHDYKGYKEITHCDCERNHQYGTMPFL